VLIVGLVCSLNRAFGPYRGGAAGEWPKFRQFAPPVWNFGPLGARVCTMQAGVGRLYAGFR
jgi:hypothetical protein